MTKRTLEMGGDKPEYLKGGMVGNVMSSITVRFPLSASSDGGASH